jgi:hypothetical protein
MKKSIKFVVIVLAVAFIFGMNINSAKAVTLTVDLGTATPFAILAGTPAITESGAHTSSVTGNVGLSPRTAADIGLYCSQVDGTIYGVNAAYVGDGGLNACFAGNPPLSNKTIVDNAKLDLTAAYLDAAGRTPVTTIDTELGGQLLTPGVYTSASTAFQISAPNPLILDAQGDASAVFIFEGSDEEAGTLTVGPGSEVELRGSAQACNVFWRVYGASINTTAVFKGSILALTSITVADGANIEGRLLAQTGQVTLINDTVTVPICKAPEITTPTSSVTELPQTGSVTSKSSIPWYMVIPVGIIAISIFLYFARRKQIA